MNQVQNSSDASIGALRTGNVFRTARPPKPLLTISTPCPGLGGAGYYEHAWRRRSTARKALRDEVRQSAAECRRRCGRASVIKHSADAYEIRIGGRQGYHLWLRLVLSEVPRGVAVKQIIED